MATFDYARIAARANAIIARFGRSAAVRRFTDSASDDWDSSRSSADTSCTAAVVEYEDKDVDGELIKTGDRMALVAPDIGIEPTTADQFLWKGKPLEIVNVHRVEPADTVVLWILQLRA